MTAIIQPRVAAIILNWRRAQDTIDCVRSVAALEYDNLDIIVCDNDSQDGSLEAIVGGIQDALPAINGARDERGLRPFSAEERAVGDIPDHDANRRRLWIAQTGHNGGYAYGNNVGIRLGLAAPDVDYVWVLNNDTVVDPGALTALVAKVQADPTIGLCGALVLYQDSPDVVQTLGGGRFRPSRARCEQIGTGLSRSALPAPETVEAEMSYVNGAATLASRAMIDAVGVMEEGYFLYYEEIDWATQARAAGFRLGYCPDAIVYHAVGAATGSNDAGLPSPMSTYYMERSKFRFLRRHHPTVLAVAYPLLAKAALLLTAKGHRQHAKAMLAGARGQPFSG